MNLNILQQFRHELYACFGLGRDALFNLADALLTETQAQSLVELSLSPYFQRKWPSIYEALQLGKLDQARFEATLLKYAPTTSQTQRVVLAVDATNIERPFSPTSSDRGYLYVHNLPECDKPVTVGWQFSTVVVVPPQTSSQTYIVSNRRIPTSTTPAQLAVEQLHELRPHFASRPLTLGDRYYPTKEFMAGVSGEYDLLVRLKANRVFYRPPQPQAELKRGRGRPAKHGPRFQCNREATHPTPSEEWAGVDETGGSLQVSRWDGLYLREAPQLGLSVIRVRRVGASRPRPSKEGAESWFVWAGEEPLVLSQVWATYKRRFSIEHGFRFDKQDLLWTKPRLREPEQFELWTALVSMVHNQLVLAQQLDIAVLRPWESHRRVASPQQVRRGLGAIMPQLGSPAKPCQSRGKGRGRAFGAKVTPARRYKVVKKGRKLAKTG